MALLRCLPTVLRRSITRKFVQIAYKAKPENVMSKSRDLTECTAEQMRNFLNSFDTVLSDCDGVLWHLDKCIDGAVESLDRLQSLGKKVYLLTNNSTVTIDKYIMKTRKYGLELTPEQVINTSKVIAWYLNKINFREEAFAIASPTFCEVLTNAGIKLTKERAECVESDPFATLKAVQDQSTVKAVIADFDILCNWGKLAFAVSCLKRKEVLYIAGAMDEWIVYGHDKKVLGCGPLTDVISKQSGRTPIECAKPSEILKDYVLELCNVENPKRCLLIGDTINTDMKFGAMCGFTKLFVNTGSDKIERAQENDETCPEFYVPSLGDLIPILDKLCPSSMNNANS